MPIDIEGVKNITISGRIASGTTTLAQNLSQKIDWKVLEGGALFAKYHEELNLHEKDVHMRPDDLDLKFEEHIKKLLSEEEHHIIQSHLAGFDAQGIDGVYKILVICEDEEGNDKTDIRIDRLVNRNGVHVEDAKQEIAEREKNNLEKWRRLYTDNDSSWVYWDPKYYDLVINTYSHNPEQSLFIVLEKLGLESA